MYSIFHFLVALLSILVAITPVQSSSQFCEVNPIESHDFCIALNTFHNETTGADDFYFTMSAKFPQGNGWLAVGSGYIMHRSLMFAMYPGTKQDSVVVGPRTTSYHDPPKFAEDMPDFRVLSTAYDNGYSSANFVCYACNRWDGNRLSIDAETQPWVWATNDFQEADSNDPNKKLGRHNYYDGFYMDMKNAQVGGSHEPSSPSITERKSISGGYFKSISKTSSNSNSYVIHGSLLGLAFGLFFPVGVYAVVFDRWSSVRSHWMIQTATSFSSLVGISFGLSSSLNKYGVRAMFGFHQLLGCAIGLALLAQLALGLWHHIQYLESQWNSGHPKPPSWMKIGHMWLGRSIYILGCTNVLIGLNMAQTSRGFAFGWIMLMGLNIVVYIIFFRLKSKKKSFEKSQHTYDRVNMSEEEL